MCSTGSRSPKSPEAPKAPGARHQSGRQGSPDGQRQMENDKETRRHNRKDTENHLVRFDPLDPVLAPLHLLELTPNMG
ncbi:hypothetical protein AV530_015672 [Patagioenas fasciata monilis]|uniref:Uncharacterized protein n=1 Tax=Patagioenas fasciata monilis TaxID=372326 RepID=A0A1V4KK58_PATFA|nr:hypothetical protein AV530_015672 [Patagioenas fasciata monilis]